VLPPLPGASGLSGVSCASTDACMAVGDDQGAPIAMNWDGATWSIVLEPVQENPGSWELLGSVACAAANSCVAVGGYGGCCGTINAFSMTWDGNSWSQVQMDPVFQVGMSGISCPSTTSCIAVGGTGPSDVLQVPRVAIVERWDGTAWTAVPVPRIRGQAGADLIGISCSRVNWCAAVGDFYLQGRPQQPLIERWNGVSLARMWAPVR
jgi:hypothetical protein